MAPFKKKKHGFTHLHLVPRLRMSGTTPFPPTYTFIAWTGKTVPFTLQTRLYLPTTTAYTIWITACLDLSYRIPCS